MIEEHGHELNLTGDPLVLTAAPCFLTKVANSLRGKLMQQLTEQAGYSYHGLALSWSRYC
ncbi:hypothetical protein DFAR_2620013 [Desulfarculales bacterium]